MPNPGWKPSLKITKNEMKLILDLQIACGDEDNLPPEQDIQSWLEAVTQDHKERNEANS